MRLPVGLVVDETGSGAKADRPGLLQVLEAARHREAGVVMVWKLNRLGRSVFDLKRNVDELRRPGVCLVGVTQGIDLDPARPDAVAKMAADMLAAVAGYEGALIVERMLAGMIERSGRAPGLGRPLAGPERRPCSSTRRRTS